MSLPETCPFCRAEVALNYAGRQQISDMRIVYECRTVIVDAYDRQRWQSDQCEKSQKAQAVDRVRELTARVAELEARCKQLEEAGNHMLEALYTPEPPRCVCNRSYPCDDCVNYSSARDAKQKWQQAKEAKP